MTTSKAESSGGPRGYFEQSRDLLNSLVLVLPLLLVYQAGLFLTRGQTLNGADFFAIVILPRWGWDGLLVFNGVLIVAGIVAVVVLTRRRRFDPKIALPMAVESTVYAVLLGVFITQVLARLGVRPPGMMLEAWAPLAAGGLADAGTFARICMALGAGVNEELVFRLGMVTGITALAERAMPRRRAIIVAVLVSSVLFSLAHYLGEPFAVYTFLYRLLAGVIFCGIFAARGFGVAVYTHAIYDVMVMVVLRQ
ncbi:MAG: CPBP family intramembrane metalloprotease [Planctomycetes bacterium]|nr:CPBP family intramembrane metalloprotease [Planctomycetota bacterium]